MNTVIALSRRVHLLEGIGQPRWAVPVAPMTLRPSGRIARSKRRSAAGSVR